LTAPAVNGVKCFFIVVEEMTLFRMYYLFCGDVGRFCVGMDWYFLHNYELRSLYCYAWKFEEFSPVSSCYNFMSASHCAQRHSLCGSRSYISILMTDSYRPVSLFRSPSWGFDPIPLCGSCRDQSFLCR